MNIVKYIIKYYFMSYYYIDMVNINFNLRILLFCRESQNVNKQINARVILLFLCMALEKVYYGMNKII